MRNRALLISATLMATGTPVHAADATGRLDDAAIAQCKMAPVRPGSVADLEEGFDFLALFRAETDDNLEDDEIRFVDPQRIMRGLHPIALLGNVEHVTILFSEREDASLRDGPLQVLSFSRRVTSEDDVYMGMVSTMDAGTRTTVERFAGNCIIARYHERATEMFSTLKAGLDPSAPETGQ